MTADDVKRLQVGETVYLYLGDQRIKCVVASRMGRKLLTCRDTGQLKRIPIDNPEAEYKKEAQA